eukprot:765370-Hanusia_phi.AAC.6
MAFCSRGSLAGNFHQLACNALLLLVLLVQAQTECNSDVLGGGELGVSNVGCDKKSARTSGRLEEILKKKGEKASRKTLLRRLAKVQSKIEEHQNRCEKLIEMTDLGKNFSVREMSSEEVSGGRGFEAADECRRWLYMERRRISKLCAYRSKLEDIYEKLFGDESEADSVDDSEKTIPWAECEKCGKERITTRLLDEDEEFVCGQSTTWANVVVEFA